MIEELEFIEQLQNVKKLVVVSSKNHPNEHVLKYLDILIDIHTKRTQEFEKRMWEEHILKGAYKMIRLRPQTARNQLRISFIILPLRKEGLEETERTPS